MSRPKAAPPRQSDPTGPVYVTHGPSLFRLGVWSEAEWAALPDEDRPRIAEHVPGLGWVGLTPVACMN